MCGLTRGLETTFPSFWDGLRDVYLNVALARAFLAKAVFDLPTTRDLIERLEVDSKLRRLCGWSSVRAVPSEATFSRAFAEFALRSLPVRLHEDAPRIKRTLAAITLSGTRQLAPGCSARDRGTGECRGAPKLPEFHYWKDR